MNWHQACELPYYHGSDLGANPTAEGTTFKLWAPTACGVVVCLYATGTDAEPGVKELGVHEMRRGDGGVWAIVLPGNLHGTYYIYRIYFPDGRAHEVVDPYARSAGANGTRGMVVDLTQAAPDGWEQDRRPDIPAHARSVWEVHVADFSADGHSGVKPEWRGKFMGFTPDDTTLDSDGEHPTCLNYLKNLGISHVQLQPIYDYATVDESRPDGGYNWGYDPQNYNVPELCHRPVPRRGARQGVPRHGRRAAPRGAGRRDGRRLQPHLPRREQSGAHRARLLEPPLAQRHHDQRLRLRV